MAIDTNSGDYNSGDYNSGNRNSGDYNSGDYNSGYYNSGNRNSGDRNSGYYNSGYYNSGNRNSGDRNSGDRNSGDYNSGNRNSGAFNRDEPKMRLFEKELDMTVSEFYGQYLLYIDLPVCEWVVTSDMTADEKEAAPSHTTTGGFLRTLSYKDAWRKWWSENPNDHDKFLKLPGFDAQIFFDITGVDVRESDKPKTINIGGTEYEVTPELTKALEQLKKAGKQSVAAVVALLTAERERLLGLIGEELGHEWSCAATIASRNDPDKDPPESFEDQCDCGVVQYNERIAELRAAITEENEK